MWYCIIYFLIFIKYFKLKKLVEVQIYFLFIYLNFDLFIMIKYLFLHKNK